MKRYKLSIVVPCFNEEGNIFPFHEACQKALGNLHEAVEFIFVNDGSTDQTLATLKQLKQKEQIKIISFSRNFGKEAAMYAGMKKASGEYITIIDADLQQQPDLILEMVSFLDNNAEYDCVAAYQEHRTEGAILAFFKRAFYKIINAMCEIDFKDGASDFRTFRYEMVQSILELNEYFRFSKGLFSWVGYNTQYLTYEANQRQHGRSSWSFVKLFKYAIEGIVAFTTSPLKIAIYLGSTLSMASLLYMIVVIIQKIVFGIDVPGYPTLVVLILLLGGVQMILLGIIGVYISKIYIQGKNRPIYIIKEYIE